MRFKAKQQRRSSRRRHFIAERLEDRRLLATLDFVPAASAGTVTEEGGRTVINVAAGTTIPITAQITTAEQDVEGAQLKLTGSTDALVISNFAANTTNFPTVVNGSFDDAGGDLAVAVAIALDGGVPLAAPPTRDIGTFDVMVPAGAANGTEFTLTADNSTGADRTLVTTSGAALPITDFGDLLIRVGMADSSSIDFVPDASAGTVTEQNGMTVINVDAGTTISVTAQVTAATQTVEGAQLKFTGSTDALVISDFSANTTNFPTVVNGSLDDAGGDLSVAVAIALDGGVPLDVPPTRDIGTFSVMVPAGTANGTEFTLSADNSTGADRTLITTSGGSLPISDFGDLRIVVGQADSSTLDLVPDASAGTVTEEGGTTVIRVAAGTTFNVSAQVTQATQTVEGAQLKFSESTDALVIGNFSANTTNFPTVVNGSLDDAGGDLSVAVAIALDGGVPLAVPPTREIGTIDVMVPAGVADGTEFTLTAGGTTGADRTLITTSGGSLPTTDFGDLKIVVGAAPPTVSVAVAPSSVAEDGTDNLVYTFSQTGTSELTVNYTVSGTATPGTDFTGTASSIVIPATGSATVTVDPTPDADSTEGNETVILTIDANAAYTVSGTAGSATGTINDAATAAATITFAPPEGETDPPALSKGALPSTWENQRSAPRRFVIDLTSPLANTPTAADITLTNLGVNADADADTTIPSSAYTVTASNGNQRITIDVPQTTDSNGIFQTLADGVYQMQISGAATGGDALTITGNATNRFFVLRGDFDGDGAVSNTDSRSIAYWFLVEEDMGNAVTPSGFVDLRTPAGINNQDFVLFRQSFNNALTFPAASSPGSASSSGAEGEQVILLGTGGGTSASGDDFSTGGAQDAALSAEGEASFLQADSGSPAAGVSSTIDELAGATAQVQASVSGADEASEAVDELLADTGFVGGLF